MSAVRRRRHPLPLLMAAAMLVGCTSSSEDAPRVVQPGAPGDASRELSASELAAIDYSDYGEADVAFMQHMILHHVQALRLTRLVPDRTAREDIPLLARRIDLSQEAELEQMRAWLLERDEPVPSLLAGHDHDEVTVPDDELMPGMLTEQELLAVEAASGEAFDRLFLEAMIRHHEGALQMVTELFDAESGATDLSVSSFANHVAADQTIEIGRMRRILDELDAGDAAG
ncbi:DUF305 domain-containing protein [Egicoccus sp. AB-alg6-2]|uniref:DUF305 domain-containing protein n=1 Tax=Egicoccus sp. AB-alg6-2 TaxID=3242692 RepID=UPI00359D1802